MIDLPSPLITTVLSTEQMRTMKLILLPAIVIYIGLIVLWLVAENRGSKRVRITLGIVVMFLSLPLPVLVSIAITQLDDNSYYAASVGTLLDETIQALESEEDEFLARLKTFRSNQALTYENRGDLLENVRAFQYEGEKLRTERPDEREPE